MLLITCLLAAGLVQAEAPPVSDGFVPFVAARGKIILPVSAGGNGPYSFLLDAGIEHPILDLSTVAALGLATTEGEAVRLANLQIGTFVVPQAVAEAADVSGLRDVLGVAVAGIMPARLGDANLAIDFSRGRLAYVPTDALPDVRRYSHTAILRPGQGGPGVTLSVNGGKPYPARVDLSYSGTLAIPKAMAQELGLLDAAVPRVEFEAPEGAPVPDGRLQVRVESVNLAGAELRRALCTVRDGGEVVVVGTGFLKHFDVFFNFAGKRLLLAPLNPTPPEEEEMVAYGVILGDFKDGYWNLLVAVNSPAYRAGVKPGDRLKTVDGEDLLNLPYEEVSPRLAGGKGRSIKLGVLRGEETKEVTVEAEPLLKPSSKEAR